MKKKILFIYSVAKKHDPYITEFWQIPLGITQLMTILGDHGYAVSLKVVGSLNSPNKVLESISSNLANVDLVCFTAVSTEYKFINELSHAISKSFPQIIKIIGGVHATLNTEEVVNDYFDYVVSGEGEFPLLELIEKIESKEREISINNVWYKSDNTVFKSETRNFIRNLDALPFLDFTFWKDYLKPSNQYMISAGRGCKYSCTYCANHSLRKVAQGSYVRYRSPQNIVKEIEQHLHNGNKCNEYFFYLEIETIGSNIDWLKTLCTCLIELKKKYLTNIRFATNYRVDPCNDYQTIFQMLADSGFEYINVGVESGNESIRRKVLARGESNSEILKQLKYAKQLGLKINTYALVGLPNETHEKFLDTVELIKLIAPNRIIASLFYPYPKTRIAELTKNDPLAKFHDVRHERFDVAVSYPSYRRWEILYDFLTLELAAKGYAYNYFQAYRNACDDYYYAHELCGLSFFNIKKIKFFVFFTSMFIYAILTDRLSKMDKK